MTIVRTRKIGLHHIAFFRSFFEGSLDIRKMAERYLETGRDISEARETLKFVQDAFVAAAVRRGLNEQAQWLILPPSSYRGKSESDLRTEIQAQEVIIQEIESELPDFDEWVNKFDPNGVMSLAENLEEFNLVHKKTLDRIEEKKQEDSVLPPSTIHAVASLTAKLDLINTLTETVIDHPKLTDLVDGWFAPVVAHRLQRVNINSLEDVLNMANEYGHRWFRHVPKVGVKTASKIIEWLNANENYLGRSVSSTALAPIRQYKSEELISTERRHGITTLETMAIPHPLSGEQGTNRAEHHRNKLNAKNDYDAIQEWLSIHSGHTFMAYRKEAERLLLWSVYEKQKSFSSLTTQDMNTFFEFLRFPGARWCSVKRYERYHKNWRPFVLDPERQSDEPLLSDRSVKQAQAITSRLFEWLVGQNYLDSNPISGLVKNKFASPLKVDRSFTRAQWQFVVRRLQSMPDSDLANARIKFLITFAYGTGLRLHEIAGATIGGLQVTDFDDDSLSDVYMLRVVGKGKKERTLPVPRLAIQALRKYLGFCGLSRDFHNISPVMPLIGHLNDPTKSVTNKTIYRLIKNFFGKIADDLDRESLAYRRFREASTHWLRHTYGSHATNSSASLATVQENMGHSSLQTTSIYVKTEDAQRWREMDGFMETSFSSNIEKELTSEKN